MTFWPLTNSDFSTDQTFHQFYDLDTELDLHQIMSFYRDYAIWSTLLSYASVMTGRFPTPGFKILLQHTIYKVLYFWVKKVVFEH